MASARKHGGVCVACGCSGGGLDMDDRQVGLVELVDCAVVRVPGIASSV